MSSRMILVTQLPDSFDAQRLTEILSSYGTITSVKLPTDKHGKHRGFAFVKMATEEEANQAVHLINSETFSVNMLHAELMIDSPPPGSRRTTIAL